MRDISILRTLSVMLLFSATLFAQVKIGDHPEQINPYALLELESTDKGLLIPRFTEVQRDQEFKESLPDGLLIYNLDKACLEVWKAKTAQWECIGRATEKAFQELRLEDHLLTLTDGGSVDLRPYLNVFTNTNTDEQLLSLQGHQLTLTNGGSVDLSAIANSGTDSQTLQLVGDVLSISGTNSVSLSAYSKTDSQTVSVALVGDVLEIRNQGQVASATVDLSLLNNSGTDTQTLQLVGDVLSISGTNSVSLSAYSKTDSQTLSLSPSGKQTQTQLELESSNPITIQVSNGLSMNVASQTLELVSQNIFLNNGEISENRTLNLNRNKFIFENGPLYLNSDGRIVAYSLSATSSGTGSNRLISRVNAVTLFLGPNHSISKLGSDQSSGDIRFNGLDLKHGDMGFYPTGGNAGGKGHFRFSLTDRLINRDPDAKLGMGDLYVANSIGIGITSPTAKLDVEGEIRLRSLTEQTTTTIYENVLVADNDGNLAKVKSNLLSGGSSSIFSSDGTLTESRTIDLNNNDFSFTNGDIKVNEITLGRGSFSSGNTNSAFSTALGLNALETNTTGLLNTAIGGSTLRRNTSGNFNTAIGTSALQSNTLGSSNTAIGYLSLFNNDRGNNNIAIGGSSLYENKTGSSNIAIGINSLQSLTTGIGNTVIGVSSTNGQGITTGSYNTILGKVSGLDSGLLNNIILADGQGNQRIRVLANGYVGIGTQTPTYKLTVNGSIGQTGANAALHPDYVFEHYFDKDSSSNANYMRYSLEEVEEFIPQHKHLPGVQSRESIEATKSWNISENVRINLEKIEELYLHTIEQEKKIEMLMQSLQALEYKLNERMKNK